MRISDWSSDVCSSDLRFGQVRYLAQLERLDEAKAKLTSLKADFPEQVELLLIEGRIALAEKRGDDAVASYRKAFELRRTNFTLIELVQALFATREVDEGLEAMAAWLMEYPQDLLVRTSLAETSMALGRLPAAEREYQAALEVAPDNAWTLNNLAWLRMSLGKAEEAVRPAGQAAEIAPGAPEVADPPGQILLSACDQAQAAETRIAEVGERGVKDGW